MPTVDDTVLDAEAVDSDPPPPPCGICRRALDPDEDHHRGQGSWVNTVVCIPCVEARTSECEVCDSTGWVSYMDYSYSATFRRAGIRYDRLITGTNSWGETETRCVNCVYDCPDCGAGYVDESQAEECCELLECGCHCEDCHYENDCDGDRGGIRSWSYRPNFIFIKGGEGQGDWTTVPDAKTLYLGFELEMERAAQHAESILSTVNPTSGEEFFYAKGDGSLSDDGFELVSMPMTPQFLLSYQPLYEGLQRAIELGARSYRQDNCGLHIHVNRDAFTPAHMWRFLTFHFENPSLCQIVGQRGDTGYAKWSGSFTSERPKVLKFAKNEESQGDRYVALNMQNEATVELRYFKGNLRPDAMKKNVEFVDSLFTYLKPVGIADIKMGALQSGSYLNWLNVHKKRYPNLTGFLYRRGFGRLGA